MNEIANFFLPLTFGHIAYVAIIIIAAIVCARIALALVIYSGAAVIGLIIYVFALLFGTSNKIATAKKRRRS